MSPCATPATQNEGETKVDVSLCHACMARKTKVDVTKCHACHAKCRGVTGDQRRPSAPRSAISATPATPATQSAARPTATKRATQCRKCHACHAKRRWMSPSATPATQSAAASQATSGDQARHAVPPATHNEGRWEIVPRLPRETKCHACHAKCRGVTGDQRRPSAPRSAKSATPATQNQGRDKVDVSLCHACHAKRR